MKKIFYIVKVIALVFVIVICSSNNTSSFSKVTNNNLDKTIDVSTMSNKIDEFDHDTLYGAKDTFTGDLTGYVYNCPACSGELACMYRYNIKDGTITYPDNDYGEVRIVASSRNLPCGSIIRFNSERVSSEPVFAIVLDRGVRGNAIDLLSPDLDYAYGQIGRSSITYDVIRVGWVHEDAS